jgi:small subunit ribosomal protein S6
MVKSDQLYDLVLMLDPAAEEAVRATILESVRATIERGGELLSSQEWGDRQLAYSVGERSDAQYHLFQMHATRELLEELQRTLRITDGVLRFRVIKVAPNTPPAPQVRPRRGEGASEGAAVSAAH